MAAPPFWALEYSNEVKFYFLDNHPYTFDLLVRIEELKFTQDGIPPEGCHQDEPGYCLWEVLGHVVSYRRLAGEERRLEILIVKPLE